MRQALPLLHCVSEDTKAKLLGMITELDSVPQPEWSDWKPDKISFQAIHISDRDKEFIRLHEEALEYYDKFMRQPPRGK